MNGAGQSERDRVREREREQSDGEQAKQKIAMAVINAFRVGQITRGGGLHIIFNSSVRAAIAVNINLLPPHIVSCQQHIYSCCLLSLSCLCLCLRRHLVPCAVKHGV